MIHEHLTKLRSELRKRNFTGYIVPSVDEYFSEYVPESDKRLEFITGFTGSNGVAMILENIVLFFTDGRYITQSLNQLDDRLFEVFDQKLLTNFSWEDYIDNEDIIVFDPKLFSKNTISSYSSFNIKPYNENLIDIIWEDRPLSSQSKIYIYPDQFAGQSYIEKIEKCREFLFAEQAESLVITNPDCVCWLLNLRAHDIEFSPLLLANCIVTLKEIYLFTNKTRLDKNILKVREEVIILPENKFYKVIQNIRGKILYDERYSSIYLTDLIAEKESKIVKNPCIMWKACKNQVEISHMVKGHIQDGVAVCEFLSFLKNSDVSHYTEYDLGIILIKYREKRDGYIMDSFPVICAYQDNGAIIHYRAHKDYAKKLNGSGLLLIDSGGQYMGATTDITRTISIGIPTPEVKRFYTKVLKGHIALATIKFPENVICGAHIDILAKQYLWQSGQDYAHGTGHGVGSFLSVHEGPQNISVSGFGTKLAVGMVISNEPGYYVPGEYGIRVENLMYVDNSEYPGFLKFNALTIVPYSKDLIIMEMLNQEEIEYLKNYYKTILKNISPLLSREAKAWLKHELSLII